MHLDDAVDNETGKLEIIFDYNKTKDDKLAAVRDSVDKLYSVYISK